MSTGLIIVIAGAVGTLASLIFFFSIKKKSEEDITAEYSVISAAAAVESTVSAVNKINTGKKSTKADTNKENKSDVNETEYTDISNINLQPIPNIPETEMESTPVNETEIINGDVQETFIDTKCQERNL